MTLKHRTQTAIADDPAYDVGADEWNADHIVATDFSPESNDAASLGTGLKAWSDAYLASGGILNFNAGNAFIEHESATQAIIFGNVGTPEVFRMSSTGILGVLCPTGGPVTGCQLEIHSGANSTFSVNRWRNSTAGPSVICEKSRSSTIGTHTIVQSGDTLGQVLFNGSDGTSFQNAAMIRCVVDGTPGTGDMPGKLIISTTPDGSATLADHAFVDNKGNKALATAALSTTATDGFVYIPTCAGAPTGTPTALTGVVPIVYDTSNNKLYVFNGAWKSATFA